MSKEVIDRIKRNPREILGLESEPVIEEVFTRHMPTSRITKVCIRIGGEKRNYILKYYTSPDVETSIAKMLREYGILEVLSVETKDFAKCKVVRPVACFEDLQTIITEEFNGETLSRILKRGTTMLSKSSVPRMEGYSQLCGKWLSNFQSVSQHLPGRPYYQVETISNIHSQLQIAMERRLMKEDIVLAVRKHIDKLAALTGDDIPITGMHSDFIPSNVIVGNGEIAVLDFAEFRKGPTYRDAITFLHALDNYLWNPIVNLNTIKRLQDQFLIGYGKHIKRRDLPLVNILEVRQILGELLNLSITLNMRRWPSLVYSRARSRLVSRLLKVMKNWDTPSQHYQLCDIIWEISSD